MMNAHHKNQGISRVVIVNYTLEFSDNFSIWHQEHKPDNPRYANVAIQMVRLRFYDQL